VPLLNLAQLRSFVVLAEQLSFSKAAQKLYITQPGLSRQIRLLEESLGTPLFVRAQRGVHLTSAAAVLLNEARGLLTYAEEVEEKIGQVGGDSRTIIIGAGVHLADSIRRLYVDHRKRYPKVNFVFREVFSVAQSAALQRREIDVGFLWSCDTPTYIVSELLFSRPLVVVLPKTHPLAGSKKLKLAQLAGETLFLRPLKEGKGLHDKIIDLYRTAGIRPRIAYTSLSLQFVIKMQGACGNGIHILAADPTLRDKDVAVVRLDEPNATREVHIAWRKGEQSPHILGFVDTARAVFKTNYRKDSSTVAKDVDKDR
jgi:DNA-binding transcriptional LysR family regulator